MIGFYLKSLFFCCCSLKPLRWCSSQPQPPEHIDLFAKWSQRFAIQNKSEKLFLPLPYRKCARDCKSLKQDELTAWLSESHLMECSADSQHFSAFVPWVQAGLFAGTLVTPYIPRFPAWHDKVCLSNDLRCYLAYCFLFCYIYYLLLKHSWFTMGWFQMYRKVIIYIYMCVYIYIYICYFSDSFPLQVITRCWI